MYLPLIRLPSQPLLAIKICHYFLLGFSTLNVIVLYIMQRKGYPFFRFTTFFINFILVLVVFHRKFMDALKRVQNSPDGVVQEHVAQQNTEIKQKTIWTTISEICQVNINTIFLDMTNCFYNSEINDLFELSPASENGDEDTNSTSTQIMEDEVEDEKSDEIGARPEQELQQKMSISFKKDKIDTLALEKWEHQSTCIQEEFVKKYKHFKELESKLLHIRQELQIIIDWSKNTLELFEEDPRINTMIQSKMRSKIQEYGCKSLLNQYNTVKEELNHLCKYLHNNLQTSFLSKCPVCITEVKDAFIVPCGHCVCSTCIQTQVKYDKKIICPICRCTGQKMGTLYL